MKTCLECKRQVLEVCSDGYCRECHVGLDFDDCVDGTCAVGILMQNGHGEDLKKRYPNAKQWKEQTT